MEFICDVVTYTLRKQVQLKGIYRALHGQRKRFIYIYIHTYIHKHTHTRI